MKLTTRGRYAVTAMLDLALHGRGGPVCLSQIAARQSISQAYLEQLFGALRRAGLVESVRGPGGGYRLGRPAEAISLAAVIAAVDESADPTRCGGLQNCQRGERCLTHDLWEDLGRHIRIYLEGRSLADVAAWSGVREVAARQSPERESAPRKLAV